MPRNIIPVLMYHHQGLLYGFLSLTKRNNMRQSCCELKYCSVSCSGLFSLAEVSLCAHWTWNRLRAEPFWTWQKSLLSCHYSVTANSEDSTQFNSSVPNPHIPAGWRLETRLPAPLNYSILYWRTLPYRHFARAKQKTACVVDEACLSRRCLAIDVILSRFGSRGDVFDEPFPSNGSIFYNMLKCR
jgi:hypothetical protein